MTTAMKTILPLWCANHARRRLRPFPQRRLSTMSKKSFLLMVMAMTMTERRKTHGNALRCVV